MKSSGLVAGIIGVLVSGLFACQSTVSNNGEASVPSYDDPKALHDEVSCIVPLNNASFNDVLSDEDKGWDECFDHNASGLLQSVITQSSLLLKQGQQSDKTLEQMLYYLRAFSYYGNLKQIDEATWLRLDSLLTQLSASSIFFENNDSAKRLQEHYLVSIYRFYNENVLAKNIAKHLPTIIRLYKQSHLLDDGIAVSKQSQYTLIELYRTFGFLSYLARKNDALKNALTAEFLPLSSILVATINQWSDDNWQLDHNLWSLANLYVLLSPENQKKLDDKVKNAVFSSSKLSKVQAKQHFSQTYLANSFRYLDSCQQDFKGYCEIPTIDDILPINHQCSDSLFIRATTMTDEQLNTSCERLIGQEQFFHETLVTNTNAVANDFNKSLRVIIFDNYSDYNRYGQLVFNIGTNNGGMYIEGTPSDPNNQATFYSFQAFWKNPEFSVWNLNHEYVHYLDGRFVKYGSFGHFPSHVVWWSEGIAEYISKVDVNPKAFKLLSEVNESDWPSLSDIFATTYKDGADRVYRWSYLAHRFIIGLNLKYTPMLSTTLKTDFFDGYKSLLDHIASKHQREFKQWLIEHRPNKQTQSIKLHKHKATPMYRYLYRNYLMTPLLPSTDYHKHFFNVG